MSRYDCDSFYSVDHEIEEDECGDMTEDMTWEEFFNLKKQGWSNSKLHNEEIRRREERLNGKHEST